MITEVLTGLEVLENKKLRKQLSKLTLSSEMRLWSNEYSEFDVWLSKAIYPKIDNLTRVVLLKNRNSIVGWGLMQTAKAVYLSEKYYNSGIYIKPEFRRTGLGSILIKRMFEVGKQDKRILRFAPYNKKTKKFFVCFDSQLLYR